MSSEPLNSLTLYALSISTLD